MPVNKSLFSPSVHHWIYFVLLCMLAASMPTSRFMMSLTQLLLGANWLLEGNYKEKTLRFWKNKPALIFISLYLLHVIGLLWSEDLRYGIGSDLKDKLPMLTLTFLVVSSRPLSPYKVHLLLYVFFASLLITTFFGFYVFITGNYLNFRDISPFVSHIYLGMMLVMAAFTLPWLTLRLTGNKKFIWASYIIAIWMVVFLFILHSLTGLLCLGGVITFLLLRKIYRIPALRTRIMVGIMIIALAIGSIVPLIWMFRQVSMEIKPSPESMQELTERGNPYRHSTTNKMRENGHYVYSFVAEEEARQAWNQRSELDFDGPDLVGNELKATLYRYLSSKGLRKDYEGVMQLDEEDIAAIERSVPNHYYTAWPGLIVRMHQSVWEVYWYRETGNPSGHTLTQRIELWRASVVAFREKPWLGWGTGDLFIAVEYGLEKIDSQMENYRMKPHNQYLLFLLTLGLVGSVALYTLYVMYVKKTRAYQYLPFNIFLVIMLVSMIGNHPIDSQTSQTFFTFFTLYFGIILPRIENRSCANNG